MKSITLIRNKPNVKTCKACQKEKFQEHFQSHTVAATIINIWYILLKMEKKMVRQVYYLLGMFKKIGVNLRPDIIGVLFKHVAASL